MLYHDKEFYQNYEKMKKNRESLISHILKNSNASLIDPYADTDEWFIVILWDSKYVILINYGLIIYISVKLINIIVIIFYIGKEI